MQFVIVFNKRTWLHDDDDDDDDKQKTDVDENFVKVAES